MILTKCNCSPAMCREGDDKIMATKEFKNVQKLVDSLSQVFEHFLASLVEMTPYIDTFDAKEKEKWKTGTDVLRDPRPVYAQYMIDRLTEVMQ